MTSAARQQEGPALAPILKKLALELGPLLVFFLVFRLTDFMVATMAFMAVLLTGAGISWTLQRRVPLLPAVATAVALAAGALTLALESEVFLKMRPSILNALGGVAVVGSALLGRNLLRIALADSLRLTDGGWRGLTWRVAAFLLTLAAVNEVVWRSFSTDVWVAFKAFGIVPLDALFVVSLWPYVKRHWCDEEGAAQGASAEEPWPAAAAAPPRRSA